MTKLVKRCAHLLLCGVLLVTSLPATANTEDEPGTWEMAADAVVARPIGAAMTVVGAVAFVASLPFSLLGGNVDEAAEKLVVDPAKAAFVRCLGCKNTGRYQDEPED